MVPIPTVETHRIRIVNAVDGAIQVSSDAGRNWQVVGRVTAPATQSLMGYLASGYSQPGTVAAVAVHGLRVRTGDTSHAYAALLNILPREFAQTPVRFGGHVSGLSGIYTTLPTGTAIFRELSPFAGNPVDLEGPNGRLTPLAVNYTPAEGDILVIRVLRPADGLRSVTFANRVGGDVLAVYQSGRMAVVTHVLKPVVGVGRFDGTSFTGVGAINTSHAGVITISTAPVTHSTLLEGVGDERRGGFQIEPAYHNSQTDEAGALPILVVGDPVKKRQPELEGTPPLFHGFFNLAWPDASGGHGWRATVQRSGSDAWQPMPTLVGLDGFALQNVTAVRLEQDDGATDAKWLSARISEAATAYYAQAQLLARAGKTRIVRGRITIDADVSDPRTRFVVFLVDGAFKAMSNTTPFSFAWDTTDVPDGEYVVETRAEDENSAPLYSSRTKFWVDNSRHLPQGAL